MPDSVRITDVSPRDGLQNEPGVIASADKVKLVKLLCASGVDEVEVTSFVSPKWVPQLADAEEVLAALTPPPPESVQGGGTSSPSNLELPLHPDDHNRRDPLIVKRARELRNSMTFPERLLWSRLKGDRIGGLRFRRQHAIGPYIADFYCPAARLVVEVDGRTHRSAEAAEHDRLRDEWIRESGIEIVRVMNDHVIDGVDSVVERIARIALERAALLGAKGVPPPDPLPRGGGVKRPVFSVLVPNEKGFERALAVRHAGLPLKIALFTAASETFSKKNTNASIGESIERYRPIVPRALAEGMPIRMYVSCAVACPFEGRIEPDAVRRVVDRLLALIEDDDERSGIEIDLGDTIGVAHPHEIEALLGCFDAEFRRSQVTVHLHDTFGRAADCVRASLQLGVRSFDGAVAGLGGCPYASTPEKRAPGNIDTELLVRAVQGAGFTTGVDLDRLGEATVFAREFLGR